MLVNMSLNTSFWKELKERRVIRVGGVYLAVAWAWVEGAKTLSDILELPDFTPRLVLALAVLGFPIAIVLVWAFQVTPEGVRRAEPFGMTGRLNLPFMGGLTVGVLAVSGPAFVFRGPGRENSADSGELGPAPGRCEHRHGQPCADRRSAGSSLGGRCSRSRCGTSVPCLGDQRKPRYGDVSATNLYHRGALPVARSFRHKAIWPFLFAAAGSLAGCAEPDRSLNQALEVITPTLIRSHVMFLSHDLLRGRDTGDAGYEIAREYVAGQYARIGLEPIDGASYLQPFDLLEGGRDMGSRLVVGREIIPWPEAVFAPDWLGDLPEVRGEGIYVGYGMVTDDRDDFAGVDVRGKVVFLLPGVPSDWIEHPEHSRLGRLKIEIALRRGAVAVVTLSPGPATPEALDDWSRQRARPGRVMALADGTTPSPRAAAMIGPGASARLFRSWGLDPDHIQEAAEEGAPARDVGSIRIRRAHEISRVKSWNVGGLIRGSDPMLRDEVVVFTAHLDHVGIGEPDERGDSIFNGTHDNAVGIGKMLASAEALVKLSPRRTLLFLAVGAEERGLLGTWHYVRNPLFPLERTAAAINQDGGLMNEAPDDVLAFGAEFSTLLDELHTVTASAGMWVNDDTAPPFSPSQGILFRSDQYPFLVAGIPAVYLMDGYSLQGDIDLGRERWAYYIRNVNHRQRDNFDPSWSFEAPARMSGLAARLGLHVANADAVPTIHPTAPIARARGHPDQPYFLGEHVRLGW